MTGTVCKLFLCDEFGNWIDHIPSNQCSIRYLFGPIALKIIEISFINDDRTGDKAVIDCIRTKVLKCEIFIERTILIIYHKGDLPKTNFNDIFSLKFESIEMLNNFVSQWRQFKFPDISYIYDSYQDKTEINKIIFPSLNDNFIKEFIIILLFSSDFCVFLKQVEEILNSLENVIKDDNQPAIDEVD